jgi:hypothetical protein
MAPIHVRCDLMMIDRTAFPSRETALFHLLAEPVVVVD